MLVCLDNEEKVYGIGFRMETPESQNQGVDASAKVGIHDFHHAQLIQKFGQEQLDCNQPIDCPCWLPESQPSFPLLADCPVTLLLCLILTLYGKEYYYDFCRPIHFIDRYLKKLDSWIT